MNRKKRKHHRIINLALQLASVKRAYPLFRTHLSNYNELEVIGKLRPSARSCEYLFKMNFKHKYRPKVHIIRPKLIKNEKGEKPPHLYPDWSLCLYLPAANEFTDKDWIVDTIIPWISLWLYYYEEWLINGEWYGGGIHPEISRRSGSKIRPSL